MPEKKPTCWKEIFGPISTRSVYFQIVTGVSSGWLTGRVTVNVGKFAACFIGGGIILMRIAHYEGYMKIDWSKVYNKACKTADKVEEAVTGEEKDWKDKAESYVDRKLDRAEHLLKAKTKGVKKWYSGIVGDDNGPKITSLHIFASAFIGGLVLGIAQA